MRRMGWGSPALPLLGWPRMKSQRRSQCVWRLRTPFVISLVLGFSLCAALAQDKPAAAEFTYFSCSGTVRIVHLGIFSPEQPSTFSLSVDLERKTIVVDDYEPMPLVGDPSTSPL